MSEAQMYLLLRVGQFKLYYANRRRFVQPGLRLWTGTRHWRVVPLPKVRLEKRG